MTDIRTIATPGAPKPAGHYAQATVYNGLVYVSGQLPIEPDGNKLVGAPVARQTEQALQNVAAILEAAGSGLDRALQITLYVTDVEHWGEVNRVYAAMLGDHKPARAVVPVRELHYGLAVEIQAVAAVR